MNEIRFFSRDRREFGWLSNFAPCSVQWRNLAFNTVEAAYQYEKALRADDFETADQIFFADSPREAKKLGRTVELPTRWDEQKLVTMLHLLRLKFSQDPLRDQLLATKHRRLIEDSPWDSFWGTGRDGRGLNWLGRLLMQVRSELQRSDRGTRTTPGS